MKTTDCIPPAAIHSAEYTWVMFERKIIGGLSCLVDVRCYSLDGWGQLEVRTW